MLPLMIAKNLELFWEQQKASRRNFVLCSGEQIFARIDFTSAFSTLADAKSGGEHWTLKRVGCLSSQVTIRRVGSVVNLATYHPNWTGSQGQVRFSTGEIYNWEVANFWSTQYAIHSEDGNELVTYRFGSKSRKLSNIFKQQAQVVITPEAWQLQELPILVLLGWYLIVLQADDLAAAATIVVLS